MHFSSGSTILLLLSCCLPPGFWCWYFKVYGVRPQDFFCFPVPSRSPKDSIQLFETQTFWTNFCCFLCIEYLNLKFLPFRKLHTTILSVQRRSVVAVKRGKPECFKWPCVRHHFSHQRSDLMTQKIFRRGISIFLGRCCRICSHCYSDDR